LTLANLGERTLQIDHIVITGEQSDDFILNAPQTPIVIEPQQKPINIGIACQPSAAGVRSATIEIKSLELEMTALYPLTCKGLAQTPAFASTPSAGSTIDFGTLLIGDTATQTLTLTETGDAPLWINLAEFNGSQEFQVPSSVFPMTLTDQTRYTLSLTCTPSSATTQTATLILNSNDPHHSSITYTLTCTGKTQPAHYDSMPAPQTPLDLGDSELGKPTTANLTVLASQVGQLTVSAAQIKGEHAQEFSLLNTPLPFTLAPQSQAQILTLQCVPTQLEQRRAQLILTTNDPSQPTVAYPLNCTGLPQPLQAAFSGKIQTQDGVIGHQMTIDAPEYFQLSGHIQPDSRHVGQLADITVTYHWQPTAGGQVLTVPVPVAHQYSLTEQVDLDLFYGTLPTATGIFEVELGYQVGEEALSAPIATLTVLANRTPVDIHLSANHVTESSAKETLIGILSTTDADKHERIVYGLINDAQGRFKVVNNELRVAQGGLLDFEYASQIPITVRAVDAAG
ncbi:MAG: choice-of-anchor D domain-containing protein, partial [Pseudomonadota bacterium]|nr:choice-of-anchor D domain-containing protein [Pseudomonadota bacterium]